ncbi:hypothetical protein RhiirA5_420090 [Rhizophagus irregularis]|uniref:RNase H type-1 domain-containing protein n=1 Tax=Rhizophagus irregularis TaxID=588596 RepID=A0A2N0PGU2_9GLOM|nr:hypothetical protein RhiirA5_420090 [Rhizophagus irregularis]
MITYLQGFLDCDACPSTIDLEPWSHTFSLRTHSLFNSLLFFSRLNIMWSLSFRPIRKDLRPAISLWTILPKNLFTSMKNKDLRFLKRVSNKGSVPAWFNYLFNLIVTSNSPSFFVLPQFRIPISHTVASISLIDISRNYLFNPQWAISFNRNTNSFLVGRVIITYSTPRNEALISHWIASSVDDLLSEFTACRDLDGFILDSFYNIIPSIFPSALRSEIFALLHGLDSLPQNSKITVATDCAQLISLWSLYVDAPFIPRMLKEPNHLLWSSVRNIISQKNLDVTLIKVPAHADDPLNNHVDALAKAAHTDSHLSFQSLFEPLAFCILQFNSLSVDMNIQKFISNIFDAKSLLTLAVLPRFNSNSSISDIDWACTKFCLNNKKQFFSYRNGRSEFCAFRVKILLDMLLTLTTLQRRKPHLYDPSWLCPQCNSFPETLNHLWTCPYILPEFSPLTTFKTLLLDLQSNYLDKFISTTSLKPLPDSFDAKFMAIDCWHCDPPLSSCLRLARGLIPISLTGFLGNYFSLSTIWSILDTPLHNFHFDLYVQIWLCCSIFFHHWELAQGITKKMKSSTFGPSIISHLFPNIPPDSLTPSLATVSLDFWVFWVSSSIIQGGSWLSHLDF